MNGISFKETIGLSWRNTIEVLFKPYSLKKWIFLFIIIALAGNLGGMNLNLDLNLGPEQQFQASGRQALDLIRQSMDILKGSPLFLGLLGGAVLASLLALFIWLFVRAVFQFVLVEALARNDASVKAPFNRNRRLGRSYFYWNIIFGSASTILLGGIVAAPVYILYKAGVFTYPSRLNSGGLIGTVVLSVLALVPALLLIVLVNTFSEDFVTVVMYSRGERVKKAWGTFLSLFSRRKGLFFLYLIVKFLLAIVCMIAAILILLLCAIILLLVLLAGGLLASLIYSMIPQDARLAAAIILLVTTAPLLVFISLAVASFIVPIPVFLRFFAIYFLKGLDDSLDPFPKEGLPPPEEDERRLKKPLIPLWAAIGVTAVSTLLFGAALFYGGSQLARAGVFSSAGGGSYVSPDEPIEPGREPDVVYLKNGGILKGLVVRDDSKTVTLKIHGGTFSVSKGDVKDIKYGEKTGTQ